MDFALDKLQSAAEAANEQTPELEGLLKFGACIQDAETRLKDVAECLKERDEEPSDLEAEPGVFEARK
jgi:predicted RNase H-like HicB family nuclease